MAFEPVLPSAADWLRDPIQSYGRMQQVLNYRIDQYNAAKTEVPKLRARIAAYDAILAKFPPSGDRQAMVAQVVKHRQAVDALEAQQRTVTTRIVEAIRTVRWIADQLKQLPRIVGLGQPLPIVPAAVIGLIAVAVYELGQFVNQLALRSRESNALGQRLLDWAKQKNLTPEQLGAVAEKLAKTPAPKDTAPGDLFGQLAGALPWVLGIVAAVYLGPPLLAQLQSGMKRRAA